MEDSTSSVDISLTSSVPRFEPVIDYLLFYTSTMTNLVEAVLGLTSGFARKGPCKWACFEDGFPNILLDVSNLPGRNVVFFADLYSPADFFSQISVLYALPKYFCKSLTVILPYFPTGTMERIDTEGQIATAQTLARMLSAVPLSSSGPTRLVIYDIHTLQNRFYFGDDVIPILLSAMPDFKRVLATRHAGENTCIAFPDEGASKRFAKELKEFDHIVCSKVRSGKDRIVKIKEGDCDGRHVFVVDDLVRTGGTLEECRRALIAAGATAVSCFVTHAVFPNDKKGVPTWKRFTKAENSDTFEFFYVTDSCPIVTSQLLDQEPFHVISLAPSIADLIISQK